MKTKHRTLALLAQVAFMTLGLVTRAEAHKASDSYLTLEAPTTEGETYSIDGHWDIALRDLDDALVLDADGNGALTRGELAARAGDVQAYALAHLLITAAGRPCPAKVTSLSTGHHSDGAYAILAFQVRCDRRGAAAVASAASTVSELALRYSLLFDLDRLHRGLLRMGTSTWILSPSAPDADLSAALAQGALSAPRSRVVSVAAGSVHRLVELGHFVWEGMGHIASGFDHLLFLLALLLPAVLRRAPGSSREPRGHWYAVTSLRPAITEVARIVTAFTLAHSLTLALAASGWIRLPSRLVEPAIAASIILAAFDNLVPLFGRDRWVVAFALGLLHGFGFSAALTDLGLQGLAFATALFGFNAGVELGQLALVALILPLSFAARNTTFYRRGALGVGSVAIALCATVWFVERAFDLS